MNTTKGHCLCRRTTFEFDGKPLWVAHCHCESCRRNTSSPFTTFVGVARDKYRFTGDKPAQYESSPGVRRLFCSTCGSPMAFDADSYPDDIHFYAASFEDPQTVTPQLHVHHAERLPWIHLGDDLPRHDRTPSNNT